MRTVDRAAPFLKVHMRDGSLFVLSPWGIQESERIVSGTGKRHGIDRRVLTEGAFSISLDSVALFETNVARTSPSVAALSVVTAISAAVTVYCVSNPKSCFGSCPTFYVSDGTRDVLQAEGFSSSIAPSLEARDVDALYRAQPGGREVRVRMVNEAYETHVVRYVDLLAIPRAHDRRIFADVTGDFWTATTPVPPFRCNAPEGDCTGVVSSFDGRERTSAADSLDLASREIVDLVFDASVPEPALVVASRQSLLPTYLLYQAFAYMGSSVGTWLAALERADAATAARSSGVVAALGGVDVLVASVNGTWDSVATIRETGPLAADVRLIRLPEGTARPVRARLRMAKGAWRVDAVGLVSLEGRVTPLRLEPIDVFARGRRDAAAREKLRAPNEPLVTFPGDAYTLVFELPGSAANYELFLETKGYYLEWMRAEWLAEENQALAAGLFLDPAGSLRRLAREFKRLESQLEASFWRSKYVGF